jgi:hypothetical protein
VDFRDINYCLDKIILDQIIDFTDGISNLTTFLSELIKSIDTLLDPEKIELEESDIF